MSEGVKLEALRAFDSKAWEEVYPILYRIAYAACHSSLSLSDREEVANETVHELLDYLDRVGFVEELKALASKVGRNRSISRIRNLTALSRGSGLTSSLDAAQGAQMEIPDVGVSTPDKLITAAQRAVVLKKALDQLKPPYGEILRDRYFYDLEYKELAEKHGLEVNSISVYLIRGREQLMELLQKTPGLVNEMEESLR